LWFLKVIVITHHYGRKKGIRWMENGLKVYYIPHLCIVQHCIFPTVIGPVALLRNIFIREQVSIYHGHVV
jgi:phosphatidylinositol glycan class A protein